MPPILARIPDVSIGPRGVDPPSPEYRTGDSGVKYRVDASHRATAGDVTTRLKKSRQAAKNQSSDNGLEKLSATIRLGVKAWQVVQSNPAALRAVGMFLLTVAAGTSMMLMMGRRPEQSDSAITTQPTPTAASSEPAWTAKPPANEPETEHDSSGAATLVPTAIGPGGPTQLLPERVARSTTSSSYPTVDVKLSPSEPLSRLQADELATARRSGSAIAAAGNYPATSYPISKIPGLEGEPLPQAQTTEPAVARFSGNIEPLSR